MRVCFWHEEFDIDVSSGTEHAAHQWHEIFAAFGVTEVAVINTAEHSFVPPAELYKFQAFETFNDFLTAHEGEDFVYVEKGKFPNHRDVWISDESWIIIGGTSGLPMNDPGVVYVTIPTNTSLYPMQAAAIVLENQTQLRL